MRLLSHRKLAPAVLASSVTRHGAPLALLELTLGANLASLARCRRRAVSARLPKIGQKTDAAKIAHEYQVTEYLGLANKLVKQALLKHRDASREKANQRQLRVDFEAGDLVRFWNRVPARRKEGPSKLKLRLL